MAAQTPAVQVGARLTSPEARRYTGRRATVLLSPELVRALGGIASALAYTIAAQRTGRVRVPFDVIREVRKEVMGKLFYEVAAAQIATMQRHLENMYRSILGRIQTERIGWLPPCYQAEKYSAHYSSDWRAVIEGMARAMRERARAAGAGAGAGAGATPGPGYIGTRSSLIPA